MSIKLKENPNEEVKEKAQENDKKKDSMTFLQMIEIQYIEIRVEVYAD